ncbi:hypothetical protein ACHAXT_003386 [Thalassiosira profunda]
MDHHQHTHPQPPHYQPQQAMAMQGAQQVGSPVSNANYMMQPGNLGQPHSAQPQQYMTASQHAQQQQQTQQQTQQTMMQQLPQHQMQQQYSLRQQHSMPYPTNSYHSRSFHGGSSVMSPPPAMGPRAKCEQVIHEAVAKACEIAVRGRCTDLADGSQRGGVSGGRGYSDGMIGNAPRGDRRRSLNYGGGTQTNGGSSSSRFNIEVDEVPFVRSTVQGWKGAPHVPLRLDIFYEHDTCYDEAESTPDQPPRPPQRELLERWCIDYIPSSSLSGNSSLNNSLSSSPSTSSPYSSRIMTGVHASEKPMVPSSHMSQLRQVCKRIVVLLRSFHCLARMLPSYRLRSLLLSNMAAGGGGVTVNNNGTITEMAAGGNGAVGWGTIGFSVHAGEPEAWDPALPSPSFSRQSLPPVPTPYGKLCLSVMYDATLNPDDMVAGLAERRSEWMQRKWVAMGMEGMEAQYVECLQPLQYDGVEQQYPAGAAPITTPPIPIAQIKQHVSISPGQPAVSSLPRTLPGRREYGSCPPAALGSPASPAIAGRSRAVSDFIIKDYHNSPRLGPVRAPVESPGNVGGVANNNQTGGLGGATQRMSGLSLAMMNEEDNTTPVEAPPDDQINNRRKRSSSLGSHQQYQQEENIVMPFGSPVTRAAFHSPPPMYQDDATNQAGSLGMLEGNNQQGTHFFQRHGGYGYGYNGANMPAPAPPVSTPPSDETIHTGRKSLAGSKSPLVMQGSSAPPSPGARTPTHASRQAPSSPQRGSAAVADGKGGSEVRQSYRRTSSSSSALLPPVTSLDILQRSPFQAMRKFADGKEGDDNRGNDVFGDYREDTLSSAIPWMVERGSGSIGVSTLGGGSSGLPMMPPMSSGLSSGRGSALRGSQREAQELPFAVDDEGQLAIGASSSRSPSKSTSRSLWGSTKADVLSATLSGAGGGGGGVADLKSTLAVSSLHHRCATDGKIRLRMFDDAKRADDGPAVGAGGGGDGLDEPKTDSVANRDSSDDPQSSEFASFREQLSDFRSFGESLMVENTQDGGKDNA